MVVVEDHQQREPSMNEITTIGLDLAKNVFQVHGVDEMGVVVVVKRLRRSQVIGFFASLPPCLIGMEACATAHHWARELSRLGHAVRLMPPQYVKAYVKRNKNDAADAAAICEAVKRPSMRFVPVKTVEQQSALLMHGQGRSLDRIAAWPKAATCRCCGFGKQADLRRGASLREQKTRCIFKAFSVSVEQTPTKHLRRDKEERPCRIVPTTACR
jgi:hypothetical protein